MKNEPKDFIERNNLRGFLALFRDWSTICLVTAFSIWADSWSVYIISVWIIGALQFGIGETLLHEASHYNLFKNRTWNDNLEFLYALPFFTRVSHYREIHLRHHKHLWEPEDPKIQYYEALGFSGSPNLFFLWFVKPVIGVTAYHYFFSDPNRFLDRKLILFWLPVILLFSGTGNLHILGLYWFLPLFWSFSSILYWAEIDTHLGTQTGTRTNINFLGNLMGHNSGYHHVHHLYPTIPWYRLPEAHRAICPDHPDISRGFLDTYRQLKQYPLAISRGE